MLPARHLPVFQQPKVIYFKGVLSTKPLKPKPFIAGITGNPAARNCFIHFSIDISIANISLYALSCSKLNFGYCLTFKINFPSFKTSLLDANSKSNRLSNPFPGNFCYCFYF